MDDFDLFQGDDGLNAAVLTQKSLLDTQDRIGVMLDIMPVGLLIHTEQGILFANQAAGDLLRAAQDRLIGQHLLDFVRPTEMDQISGQFRSAFGGRKEVLAGEVVIGPETGTQRLVRVITANLPWAGNPVILIMLQDITDQKRAENSLRQLTITDELTGAYNRRHALYEGTLHVEAGRRRDIPLSVVMIDIDHFKAVNDRYGHETGDLALRRLASLANATVPLIPGTDSAMFARLGGEEFVILLPGLGTDEAVAAAERFRRGVEGLVTPLSRGELRFTVSAGVATLCAQDQDLAALLRRADEALYEAKGAGRNRVVAAREHEPKSARP